MPKSELGRICGQILLDHQCDLEDDSVVEFTQIESRQLLYLFKTVNERVSVNEKLSRCLGNVQAVLKELLDSEERFMVERFD